MAPYPGFAPALRLVSVCQSPTRAVNAGKAVYGRGEFEFPLKASITASFSGFFGKSGDKKVKVWQLCRAAVIFGVQADIHAADRKSLFEA